MTGKYRIRWANVTVCGQHKCWKEPRCIAERRVNILGIIRFWWPLDHAGWWHDESGCYRDIQKDMDMRVPLPEPQLVDPEA